MKIVCLAENTANNPELQCEHGLSLYIESQDKKILFDMGQTSLFATNANKLNIDLSKVDFAILSHGHYDHGGGLENFFEINKNAPVYVSPFAFEPHFNAANTYIGLDERLAENERFVFTNEVYEIAPGFTLFSCNEKKQKYDAKTTGMTATKNGVSIADTFDHEQYLLVEEDDKKILVSGCSHKGIMDIADWFEADVLVGGFHFSKLPLDKNLQKCAEILNSHTTTYYTCHCTGKEQFDYMRPFMKNLHYLSTGDRLEL